MRATHSGGAAMSYPTMTSEEIARRGKEWYEKTIRAQVETEENIGKIVSIDVETGDYEIGDDRDVSAPFRLRARHPGAAVYGIRIGYNAVYALGGTLERVHPR
jgi:hypothetical protein